jgi:hypothetical protein
MRAALESGEWSLGEVSTAETERAWKSEKHRECVGRTAWPAVSCTFTHAAMSVHTASRVGDLSCRVN